MVQLVVSNALRLCSNLILARLLAPEAFGFIGLAMVVIIGMTLLSDIGINRSIIREPDGETEAFLRAAWRVKVIRSMGIAAGVLVAAFFLWLLGPSVFPEDSAYADPIMPGLIAATAVTALLSGLESTNGELAQRRMAYRRVVAVQLSTQVVMTIATLTAAVFIPSAWAILIGMIVGGSAALILTHTVYSGPRMGWNADPEIVARLWHFGRWIVLSSTLGFIQLNADKLILAALLSPTALGHYAIAIIWVEASGQLYHTLRYRIAYPAFSEIALTRLHDLPRVYRRLQRLGDAYIIASFLALHFGSTLLIGLLYPETYADTAHFLALAAIAVFGARFQTHNDVLASLGDSRAMAVSSAIRTVALIVSLPIGWHLGGVDGLIVASALHSVAQAPYLFWKLKRHMPSVHMKEEIGMLLFAFVAAAAALR